MLCPRCKQTHAPGVGCRLTAGTVVGDYTLQRELGRGSSAMVYLAQQGTTQLEVALKLVNANLLGDAAVLRRLQREGRVADALGPSRVARVLEVQVESSLGAYMVMEPVRGTSFLELARQRIAPDEALRLLTLAADLLGEAHRRKLVHAALRPTNLFRLATEGKPGAVLALPFGVNVGGDEAEEVLTYGSSQLRPPEQSQGEPANPRMDVYSLGAIAYVFATGRFPFTAPNAQGLERAHAEVVPLAPHRVNPRISRGWSLAIMKSLEKDPALRFANGDELAQAFREAPAAADPAGTTTGMFLRPDLKSLAAQPVQAKVGVVVLGGEDEGPVPAPPMTAPTPVHFRPPSIAPVIAAAPLAAGLGAFTETAAPSRAPSAPAPAPIASGLGAFTETAAPSRTPSAPAAGVGAVAQAIEAELDPFEAAARASPPVTGDLGEFTVTTPTRRGSVPVEGLAVTSGPTPAPVSSSPSGLTSLVLRVRVADATGQLLGEFSCNAVTRSGLIACTSGPRPALLSQVKLTFIDLDGLSCDAQVVQHISADQAAQWKMSAGFGVAFANLSAEQRAHIEQAQRGSARLQDSMTTMLRRPDDAIAQQVLDKYSPERGDFYAVLGISKAARFEAIQDRVREARKALDELGSRSLSARQIQALTQADGLVTEIEKTLLTPSLRLEYDAARGNFEGVARCISAGVSVAELEAARARFLEDKPGLAGKSQGFLLAAQTQEARQQMPQALQTYAETLKFDPLNLTAHQRYWAVRRQLDG